MLAHGYFLDKAGVYYNEKLIPQSDSNDCEQIECYIKTKNTIFLFSEALPIYDASSFEVLHLFKSYSSSGEYELEGAIVKDKNGIYSHTFLPLYGSNKKKRIQKLENIDYDTFHFLGTYNKGYMLYISAFEDKDGTYVV